MQSTPNPANELEARAALRQPAGERVLVYINQGAGASHPRQEVDLLVRSLDHAGFRVSLCTEPGPLLDAASEATAARELRCVISVGGDGTFNLVLNHTPPNTPLVAMPAGTENLLAGYLRHSRRPEVMIRLLREGGCRTARRRRRRGAALRADGVGRVRRRGCPPRGTSGVTPAAGREIFVD